jgi:hypothetical protein
VDDRCARIDVLSGPLAARPGLIECPAVDSRRKGIRIRMAGTADCRQLAGPTAPCVGRLGVMRLPKLRRHGGGFAPRPTLERSGRGGRTTRSEASALVRASERWLTDLAGARRRRCRPAAPEPPPSARPPLAPRRRRAHVAQPTQVATAARNPRYRAAWALRLAHRLPTQGARAPPKLR